MLHIYVSFAENFEYFLKSDLKNLGKQLCFDNIDYFASINIHLLQAVFGNRPFLLELQKEIDLKRERESGDEI